MKALHDRIRQRYHRELDQADVVNRIHASIREGPLLLLQHLQSLAATVCVVTRHSRGVRGRVTGRLVAFDRHLNLILRDAVEVYTFRTRVVRAWLRDPASGYTSIQPSD